MYREKLDYYNYENNNYNQPMFSKDENEKTLYDPYNGFIRGNMFESLYNEYKIRPLNLEASNDKEMLLLYVDMFCFAAHDINLYLDIHPNDKDMIELYNEYRVQSNNLLEEYQSRFGPVFVNSDATKEIPWSWDNEPWPWEN